MSELYESNRILIPLRAYDQAIIYANNSIDYTHNYPGWEDKYKKYERVLRGQLSQLTLIYLFQLYGKNIKLDNTNFYEDDLFDFIYNNKKFDIKSTYFQGLPMQVNAKLKNKDIDYFIYSQVDIEKEFVIYKGFIEKDNVFQDEYLIKEGQQIRFMNNVPNRFDSYFYTGSYHEMKLLFTDFI